MSEKPTYQDLQRRIQELEKAEFERNKTEQARRESEESFRQVYKQMAVGVARVLLEFQIEGPNEAYCSILGYREEELIGKHLRDITHPETVEENQRKQSQLVAGEIDHYRMEKRYVHPKYRPSILEKIKARGFVDGAEIQFWNRDNQIVLTRVSVRVIEDKTKGTIYEGFMADITDQKRAEEALRETEEKLARSNV